VVQARAAQSQRIILSSLIFLLALAASVALIAMPFTARTTDSATEEGASAQMPKVAYTAARLAELRNEGRPVFVNLTAAWCVSCLYNERVALATTAVADKFKATNTAYVVGDWTNQNAEIGKLLKEHGREGVPLYLYYPAGGGEPQVLPQILTETLILETVGASK
jgi:thiol:disulfide interchange protein